MKAPVSFVLVSLFGFALGTGLPAQDTRPNILWITIEDWAPELSCYGTKGFTRRTSTSWPPRGSVTSGRSRLRRSVPRLVRP